MAIVTFPRGFTWGGATTSYQIEGSPRGGRRRGSIWHEWAHTLMDNFEWAYGYTMPFGLARTDFATQERQWRKSALWYQALIRRGWLEVSS